MHTSVLFRQLIGVADPEISFLLPILKADGIALNDIATLRRWCTSDLIEKPVRSLAIVKMITLGVLEESSFCNPLGLLDCEEVERFPPVSFFKWRMSQSKGASDFAGKVDSLLDHAVSQRYPPALTALALKKMEAGLHIEFDQLLQDAASLGDPLAMDMLGNILLSKSESKNVMRGIDLIMRSADAGFFLACVRLEGIYRSGSYGIPIDLVKAEHYASASEIWS